MLTIGFTTVYYTLWDVNPFVKWVPAGAGQWKPLHLVSYQYLRNLSMDLEAAKAKVMTLGPTTQYDVDLSLHGHSYFERPDPAYKDIKEEPKDYVFTFGRMKGVDIRTVGGIEDGAIKSFQKDIEQAKLRDEEAMKVLAEFGESQVLWTDPTHYQKMVEIPMAKYMKDVAWQLDRAMRMESTPRRRVYARRRLIELGELVRRDWFEKVPIPVKQEEYENSETMEQAPIQYKEVKHRWMPKALANWHETIGDKKGLWYTDKQRVELTLTELKSKLVDTQFGSMWIINYRTQDGLLVTYKGGTTPANQRGTAIDHKAPFKVVATIQHKNGETFIQRLKEPK